MSAAIFIDSPSDFLGRQVGDRHQGAGGGQGVVAAGADADDAVFRLQHVAVAGEGEAAVLVGDGHQRLQPAQVAVGAPVLGEFDAGALKLVRDIAPACFPAVPAG